MDLVGRVAVLASPLLFCSVLLDGRPKDVILKFYDPETLIYFKHLPYNFLTLVRLAITFVPMKKIRKERKEV